ncbi:Ig-like domain-containing protein [Rudaea sp.]|uniref:Ig-like domain-containing protein n=1 Tax=Rudaea sp. TaxID=2136325 RepID=UPI002ED558B9
MRCSARRLCPWLCLLLSLFAFAVQAATLTVNNNADSGPGSLRGQIAAAASGDTIDFAADLTIVVGSTLNIAKNLTIDATGHNVAVDGGHAVTVFQIGPGANVHMTYLTVQNGTSPIAGGIGNSGTLTLDHCTVSGNASGTGGQGGGILNAHGVLTITNSTISGNTSPTFGAGIANVGTMTLTNSTVSGNSIPAGGTGSGGGIYNDGAATLTNCTVSGNSAPGTPGTNKGGGGIHVDFGLMTITNCTISGNSSANGNDILVRTQLTLANTILAGSCALVTNSVFIDNGGNISGTSSCPFTSATSKTNAPSNLGPLANNGGPTQTMVPGVGSAAIDAGIDSVCTAAPVNGVDQRGVTRPQGAHCDSGAVEVLVPQVLTVVVTGGGTVSAGTLPAPQSGSISNCTSTGGANCSASYVTGQSVVLTAMVPPGQNLTWGGACATAGSTTTATVTMSAAENCTAAFALNTATTALASSSSTSTYGQVVTFTATVAAVPPATATPTGTVTFLDGGSSIGTGTLSGGVAMFTISALSGGSHTITAQYGGDSNFPASAPQPVSNTQTQTVNQAGQTITFTSTPPASPTVTGSYTVSATGGASGKPVVFSIDANSTAGACTIAGNVVSFTGTGTCIVDANQAGNTNYAAAQQVQQTITVGKKTTTVSLAAAPNPIVIGQPVTLTATVAGDPPTGSVSFTDNGTPLPCSPVTLVPGTTSSTASCTVTLGGAGSHSIVATYSGDGNFVGATSSALIVTVSSPPVAAPALDRWALLLLGSLLGAGVFWRGRRSGF